MLHGIVVARLNEMFLIYIVRVVIYVLNINRIKNYPFLNYSVSRNILSYGVEIVD